MRVRKKGVCRGDGKIYTKLAVEGVADNNEIEASAHCGGSCVPVALYRTQAFDERGSFACVMVLPILTIKSIIVSFREVDEWGEVVGKVDLPFSFEAAKWKSRINYRLDEDLCDEIRDFDDRFGSLDKAQFTLLECIESQNGTLARGELSLPFEEDNEWRMSCVDGSLNEVKLHAMVLGETITEIEDIPGLRLRKISLSMLLNDVPDELIFLIEDRNHPEFFGFEVVEGFKVLQVRDDFRHIMTSAQIDSDYNEWFKKNRISGGALSAQGKVRFSYEPLFSIVVPLFKTPESFFLDMLNSVSSQSYRKWELILVNASSEDDRLSDLVEFASRQDDRVKIVVLDKNNGISGNTNAGIERARGDFVCFLDHDDTLEPNALFEYARLLNKEDDIDVLYCDEDKLSPKGLFEQPFFKPCFDIDLLRSWNYICHFLAIRKTLLDVLDKGSSEFDGAQDHHLILQASERARRIQHVPHVLYHWRMSQASTAENPESKKYAVEAGVRAVKSHLARQGIEARVTPSSRHLFTYDVEYALPKKRPLVSIIIPTKDHIELLSVCIESIVRKTSYNNYEIIVVENNSVEPTTFSYYDSLAQESGDRIKIVEWPADFNFSKIVNFGVEKAEGDFLLFLNNDTEVITGEWIERMLGLCLRDEVGAVGARLYFKDNTIQHAGVCIAGGVGAHIGRSVPKEDEGYYCLYGRRRSLCVVTAACMMVRREVFDSVGGFTEDFASDFNDVDFCFKVRAGGHLVVYEPSVELYHYESISRGPKKTFEEKIRFHKECALMNYRWASEYLRGDPFYNPNLNQTEPLCCYYHL